MVLLTSNTLLPYVLNPIIYGDDPKSPENVVIKDFTKGMNLVLDTS